MNVGCWIDPAVVCISPSIGTSQADPFRTLMVRVSLLEPAYRTKGDFCEGRPHDQPSEARGVCSVPSDSNVPSCSLGFQPTRQCVRRNFSPVRSLAACNTSIVASLNGSKN
jgi:hypothetical protein